jgi:small subunit ribosomal protein S17
MADDEKNEIDAEGASADAEALEDETAADEQAAPKAAPEQAEAAAEAVEAAQQADEPIEAVVPDAANEEAAPAEEDAEPSSPQAQPADQPQSKAKKKRLPRALRRQRSKPARERPKTRRPITRLPKPEAERARRQERQGTVVSDAADKTIVVKVDVIKAHPRYKKVVRRSTKFHAHDETNEAKVGDVVRIVETRPLSKQKRWRLVEIVEVAK